MGMAVCGASLSWLPLQRMLICDQLSCYRIWSQSTGMKRDDCTSVRITSLGKCLIHQYMHQQWDHYSKKIPNSRKGLLPGGCDAQTLTVTLGSRGHPHEPDDGKSAVASVCVSGHSACRTRPSYSALTSGHGAFYGDSWYHSELMLYVVVPECLLGIPSWRNPLRRGGESRRNAKYRMRCNYSHWSFLLYKLAPLWEKPPQKTTTLLRVAKN